MQGIGIGQGDPKMGQQLGAPLRYGAYRAFFRQEKHGTTAVRDSWQRQQMLQGAHQRVATGIGQAVFAAVARVHRNAVWTTQHVGSDAASGQTAHNAQSIQAGTHNDGGYRITGAHGMPHDDRQHREKRTWWRVALQASEQCRAAGNNMMDEQASRQSPLQTMVDDKHRPFAFSILKMQPDLPMRTIKLFAMLHRFFMLVRKHCEASIRSKMQQCLINASFTAYR
jgi:hypothetical protein